jgi:hypothetical protein
VFILFFLCFCLYSNFKGFSSGTFLSSHGWDYLFIAFQIPGFILGRCDGQALDSGDSWCTQVFANGPGLPSYFSNPVQRTWKWSGNRGMSRNQDMEAYFEKGEMLLFLFFLASYVCLVGSHFCIQFRGRGIVKITFSLDNGFVSSGLSNGLSCTLNIMLYTDMLTDFISPI